MRKNFGPKPMCYPMPVYIIGTYNADGTPNAMNAAWGGITEEEQITICVDSGHKTAENLIARKAFTVSMVNPMSGMIFVSTPRVIKSMPACKSIAKRSTTATNLIFKTDPPFLFYIHQLSFAWISPRYSKISVIAGRSCSAV